MVRTSEPSDTATTLLRTEGIFVVHLREDSDPQQRLVSGRIEHVMSGESEAFLSLVDLLDFMARHLAPTLPRKEK